MIVDTPLTYNLTLAQARRRPMDDDAALFVPSQLSPVVLSLYPTNVIGLGGAPIADDSSHFQSTEIAITNSAATFLSVLIVPPGLWEFEVSLATQFDFVSPVGTLNGIDVRLSDVISGANMNLLKRIAAIGSFVDFNRNRMLLRRSVVLRIGFGATTVAQHSDASLSVNCIRII